MMNEAQSLQKFSDLGAAISDLPAGDLRDALFSFHCDLSEKESAVAAMGAFDAGVWEMHPDAPAWYRAQWV
jgi:hypothetical protein